MSADLGPGTDTTPDLPASDAGAATSDPAGGRTAPGDAADGRTADGDAAASDTAGVATGDGAPQDEGAPRPATSDPQEFQDDPTLSGLGGADQQGGGAG